MDKYLIINADDFGMCRAANMAVADLFQKGGITSATIMTPCGWAKNAGIWAKNNPEHAVGVHLTLQVNGANTDGVLLLLIIQILFVTARALCITSQTSLKKLLTLMR